MTSSDRKASVPPGSRSLLAKVVRVLLVVAIGAPLVVLWFMREGPSKSTAEIVVDTQMLSYTLEPNRVYAYEFPNGRYSWVTLDLDAEEESDVFEATQLRIQHRYPCEDDACVFREPGVRFSLVLGATGHLRATWEVPEAINDQVTITLLDTDSVELKEIVQLGYRSVAPLGLFRSTQLGRDLTLGSLVSAQIIKQAELTDTPIVLGGSVRFFAERLISRKRYIVDEMSFGQGDQITVAGPDRSVSLLAWMQVAHHPNRTEPAVPHFEVTARVGTSTVWVNQNQPDEVVEIGANAFDRFLSEPAMVFLGAFILAGFTWVSALGAVHQMTGAPALTGTPEPVGDKVIEVQMPDDKQTESEKAEKAEKANGETG